MPLDSAFHTLQGRRHPLSRLRSSASATLLPGLTHQYTAASQVPFVPHLIFEAMRSMGACTAVIAISAYLVTPSAAFSPAPIHTRPLGAVQKRSSLALVASKPPRRPADAVMAAHASPQQAVALPPLRQIIRKAIFACAMSCVAILLSASRAFATTSTATRGGATSLISPDMLKWGALGGVIIIGNALFSKEKAPTIVETPMEDGLPQEKPMSLDGPAEAAESSPAAAGGAAEGAVDDGLLFSSLQGRMQSLAEERLQAEAAEEDTDEAPPAADSTDAWGEGNTAVLEPPKPEGKAVDGVLEGPPAVDFPAGFPLIDGEVVEREVEPAAASEDQIAMLKRMMGEA